MQRRSNPTKYEFLCIAVSVVLMLAATLASAPAVSADGTPSVANMQVPAEPTETIVPVETEIPATEPVETEPPTLEPTETPTPEPTVTDVPTLEPTTTETPTPEPTIEEPTMEPDVSPTATTDPTPSPTVAPSPTPSPAATPSPTPTKAPRSLAPVSVISGDLCTLNGPDVVGFGHDLFPYAVFNCKGTMSPVALSVSAPTTGWEYQIVESRTSPNTWRTSAFGPTTFDRFGDYRIHFGPSNGSISGCGQLTVTMKWQDGTTKSSLLEAEAYKTNAKPCLHPSAPTAPTAHLEGSLAPLPFSLYEQQSGGSLQIMVNNPAKTSGWSFDVSATDLAYMGFAPGQSGWPASSLRVQVGGQSISLSPSTKRIVSNGGSDASYSYPITLSVPAGAAVGTYTGTVTLTITAAPGTGR